MIANLVRGRDAAEALPVLDFTFKSRCALREEARSRARSPTPEQKNPGADIDASFISKATVDKGPNTASPPLAAAR